MGPPRGHLISGAAPELGQQSVPGPRLLALNVNSSELIQLGNGFPRLHEAPSKSSGVMWLAAPLQDADSERFLRRTGRWECAVCTPEPTARHSEPEVLSTTDFGPQGAHRYADTEGKAPVTWLPGEAARKDAAGKASRRAGHPFPAGALTPAAARSPTPVSHATPGAQRGLRAAGDGSGNVTQRRPDTRSVLRVPQGQVRRK